MQDSDINRNAPTAISRWLEIIAFIIVSVILLIAGSYITDPIRLKEPEMAVNRDRNIVAALTEEPDTMDVIVVGDSEAMVMVSTKMLMDDAGISSYNCNQLGQRVSETYFFLKKLLEKQHPKLMILETNVITQDTSFNTEVHFTYNALVQEAFPIIKYHSNWRRKFGVEDAPERDAYKGYEAIEVVDPYSGEEYMEETEDYYEVNPIALYYLDKIFKLCEEKDVDILMVSSPSSVNMNYAKHNTLQKIADSYGVKFIDFNLMRDELGLDWSNDTGDAGDHINANGTEKTTGYLIDYLNDNYDLPDHR